MLVRMNGHHMVALELATRLYKRYLSGNDLRRLNYHRNRFIELMLDTDVVERWEDKFYVHPGTARIEFSLERLIMLLDIAKMAQSERIVVDRTLNQAVTKLEQAHAELARTRPT